MSNPTTHDLHNYSFWLADLKATAQSNGVTRADVITAIKLLLYPHSEWPLVEMLDWSFCADYLRIYEELQND